MFVIKLNGLLFFTVAAIAATSMVLFYIFILYVQTRQFFFGF